MIDSLTNCSYEFAEERLRSQEEQGRDPEVNPVIRTQDPEQSNKPNKPARSGTSPPSSQEPNDISSATAAAANSQSDQVSPTTEGDTNENSVASGIQRSDESPRTEPTRSAEPSTSQSSSASSRHVSSSRAVSRRQSNGANVVRNSKISVPPGYEIRTTPQGQVYYYQVATGSSSWYHPSVDKNVTSSTAPLPPGWELRTTANGKVYFVDHSTRTTHFTDPRLMLVIEENNVAESNNRNNNRLVNNAAVGGASGGSDSSAPSDVHRTRSESHRSRKVLTPNNAADTAVGSPQNGSSNASVVPRNSVGSSTPASQAPATPRGATAVTPGSAIKKQSEKSTKSKQQDLSSKIKGLKMELQLLQPHNGHCRIEINRKDIFEVGNISEVT